VTEVSRRLDVATSLIYQWRQQAMGSPRFVADGAMVHVM
jgi:transposase-like protein